MSERSKLLASCQLLPGIGSAHAKAPNRGALLSMGLRYQDGPPAAWSGRDMFCVTLSQRCHPDGDPGLMTGCDMFRVTHSRDFGPEQLLR